MQIEKQCHPHAWDGCQSPKSGACSVDKQGHTSCMRPRAYTHAERAPGLHIGTGGVEESCRRAHNCAQLQLTYTPTETK